MADEILDRHLAFQPNSGWFGWMPSPTAKIVRGDEAMNQREKVLAAVTRLLESDVELEQAEKAVERSSLRRQEAGLELARVLKAVYGDRSGDGVIYKGHRYYIDDEGQLAWQSMAAEVLV